MDAHLFKHSIEHVAIDSTLSVFFLETTLPAAVSSSSARSYIGISLFVAIMWSIVARLTSRLHVSNLMVSFLILVSMP